MTSVLLLLACPSLMLESPADVVALGRGRYRTDLPPGSDGTPRRTVKAKPLVSKRVTGAIPTNDWWSSLVWPMHSPHSMPMFPHPLALQAHADGLGIGYTHEPVISDHRHNGKTFQRGTGYRYPFRQSLLVGLEGVEAAVTELNGYSDWAVTCLWQQDEDTLRATFAHGSPFVYFETTSQRPMQIRFSAPKVNAMREPVAPYVFEWNGITAKHTGSPASIRLAVNAGRNAGIGSKARIVYDFDGDGTTDRIETFKLFATDPVPGSWEVYSSEKQSLDEELSRGDIHDFNGGTARVEFWKCFGKGGVELKLSDCAVSLPIVGGGERTPREPDGSGIAGVGVATKAPGAGKVFYEAGGVLGVSLNGCHFGVFGPAGSAWGVAVGDTVDSVRSRLAGKRYLSVAVLPDSKETTIQWFKDYAYAFLRDTRISYRYTPGTARVTTTYRAVTEAMQGTNTDTVFALYRHQHLHAMEPSRFQAWTYASPRGEMRVLAGKGFETSIPFLGVLPALPNSPADEASLRQSLAEDIAAIEQRTSPFERTDTYWNGKEFGKFCELVQIAQQLGENGTRDRLVAMLKTRLADWFDGEDERFFHYDGRWGTLTGYPDSYGSGDQLNDHHFHYSYFVKAAATIAQYDPEWVSADGYGGMVDLLIRDCANADRDDRRFPWMRNLDPYAGHSWASGHAGFASGNNQESSSESMNFATALILYGEVTGRDEIRDLGIYWHSTEAEAIRQYWFDQDRAVFPVGYAHSCVGMVWGDGGSYGTWWTANPEEIHGINVLPLNGGSLYLGRAPDYVRRNTENLRSSNRNFHAAGFPGDPETFDRWQDILFGYLALGDADDAHQQYNRLGATPPSEFGETRTHTRQWIGALRELGTFDADTRGDCPTSAVFAREGRRTYVVYNATRGRLAVTFTDGVRIDVPAGLSSVVRPSR